jgi:Family of unknown function (DUF6262)
MRSVNSYRPQNQHPDGLIQYQKDLAQQHREQVRVTIQAMHRRNMKPHEITVEAVVKESGVSRATIYRNKELFALIQHANPNVQRRQSGQVYEQAIQQLQEGLAKAEADREYYQKEAQFAKSGGSRPQQEVIQLKKKIVSLQRRVAFLEEMLARCTCGGCSEYPSISN